MSCGTRRLEGNAENPRPFFGDCSWFGETEHGMGPPDSQTPLTASESLN